ncbi:unnamed protein product [Rotaria sp. Silwood2]|nr:unnamed protein product [Rotaria sp. Silwood2]CAF4396974.1 unnamed protein product [Rotaria sp. Silwood2]CAF4401031.1 unnamed protein product [Rotaria sp. Silwood2]
MISAVTYNLRRQKIDENNSSLFESVRYANGNMDAIDNKRLFSLVVDYIGKNENLHYYVLERNTSCKTIKDYCIKIEKGNLQGGEAELRALSMLCRLLICIVSIKKTPEGSININFTNYGEHVKSFHECIYLLYDEENQHYDALYAVNIQNQNEKITIFKRNDEVVLKLLDKFIREEIHYDANIESDNNNLNCLTELPTEPRLLNETERIENLFLLEASLNSSNKRKTPDCNGLLRAQTTVTTSSSTFEINKNDFSAKRTKFDNTETSSLKKNNIESLTIQKYLEMDIFDDKSEQSTENRQTVLNDEHEAEKMRFEIEPALEFRGRTAHDFKPKKAERRNGKPSEVRAPRYFADQNNRHYLNLLISNTYLLADLLEICLEICIVTREIHGYTYIQPYFKFQVHPTDPESPNLNPRYIFLNSTTELKAYLQELQQLKLQLVVVMLTNPELMQSEQPLKIFALPKNNDHGKCITTKYDNHKDFKKAYSLHDLRFAITLWRKEPGEKVFHRHPDKQYISQISKEDKNVNKNIIFNLTHFFSCVDESSSK